MLQLKKYRNRLTEFISSDEGQQFFNFAYSIGAAIVIWGALFKILHIRGGDTLLAIGMGTEVIMFVLTAFDRPPHTERPETSETSEHSESSEISDLSEYSEYSEISEYSEKSTPSAPSAINDQLQQLCQTTAMLNKASATLLSAYEAINAQSDSISESGCGFAAQMQALDRNIRGLNTIYEIQLKNVSSQLDSIDRVNQGMKDMRDMYEKCAALSARYCEEAEKMAHNMAKLNQVYENMVTAMTVNMNMRPHTDGIQQ